MISFLRDEMRYQFFRFLSCWGIMETSINFPGLEYQVLVKPMIWSKIENRYEG